MEPEGMERLDDGDRTSTCGRPQGPEAIPTANGVCDVLRRNHPDAVPDRQRRTSIDLPVAVLESLARGLPSVGRAAARLLAVLTPDHLEVGVRMPRSAQAI